MKKQFYQIIAAISVLFLFFPIVQAKIEWNILDSIDLEERPISIAMSKDGKTTYILCEKSIKVHSKIENKIIDSIPLTDSFSQITISPDGENLLLTDTKNNRISIIEIVQIFDMKIGQSPILGKADAPVTIFDFTDYQ